MQDTREDAFMQPACRLYPAHETVEGIFIGSAFGMLWSIRCDAPFDWISLFSFSRKADCKSVTMLRGIANPALRSNERSRNANPESSGMMHAPIRF